MRNLAGLLLVLFAFGAAAQPYPTRPVRVLVGFPPGGGTDIAARLLTPKLSEYLGQQFVVENRPGATTNIASDLVAKSAPDGQTLLFTTSALFKVRSRTDILHIPYKGTAASLTAVIAGEVQFSFANVPAILGHVRNGRLRALAVAGARRSDLMPEVPTMKEAGVEGVEVPVWYALLAPAATPRDIINSLGSATARAARSPDTRQKLIEQGADVNKPAMDTGESPLHAALCNTERLTHDRVLKVLLGNGANPNCVTKQSVETSGFMRDCRTKGETPLHRAAAFGTEETIQMLLDARANIEAKDMNGDSPLSWASWYARPDSILRMLCYGDFHIRPDRRSMAAYLLGEPHV